MGVWRGVKTVQEKYLNHHATIKWILVMIVNIIKIKCAVTKSGIAPGRWGHPEFTLNPVKI